MTTLYRKYRPQNFEEVVGQNHIKVTLQNELATGKTAHAYLFCGPRAVGKTTLARVLAKSLNCLKRKDGHYEPCNTCEACQEITAGRSLDVIEIDAASNTGVDNVRDNIIASARTAPSKNKFKVFIIDEVHMLSTSAFNALLKIMEEPPAHVVFILCTTEIHKVPATIISRCQRFDFKRISVSDVVKKLTFICREDGIKINKEILETIARQSEGHMRDAESALGQLVSIGGKEITQAEADLVIPRSDIGEIINLLSHLTKKDAAQGIKLINDLLDNGIDLKSFTVDLIEVLRKLLIGKINPALAEKLGLDIGESLEIKLNEVAKDLTVEKISLWINKFSEARGRLKDSFIVQMPLELAIVELSLERNTIPNLRPLNTGANTTFSAQRPRTVLSRPAASPSVAASSAVKVDIKPEEIKQRWNEVLVNIKKHNHSLSFILRACEPRGLDGNQLCLAFKYKFHKERVASPQIKQIIESVLREVYGVALILEAIVDESLEIGNGNGNPDIAAGAVSENVATVAPESVPASEEKPDGQNQIDNLLKTFGGRIVK